MTRVIVLGGGRIGAVIARDLAADPALDVTVADTQAKALERLVGTTELEAMQADLASGPVIREIVRPYDIVVGALPRLGRTALQAVIEAGRNYVDISFMPEDALALDGPAIAGGVTAVVDCGVAPGLANMLVGFCHGRNDATHRVDYYVGGLPFARRWPYQYKAPFAPLDVIEEYTRPARCIENGIQVSRPALSEPHLVDFPHVGTLEASLTDGLRSLLTTIPVPFMKEWTLRYPGHIELMRTLRETGFLAKEPVDLQAGPVRPIDLTARLLFPHWELGPAEPEFTVLRVVVSGEHQGRAQTHQFDLFDQYDAASGMTSMARTTAFPCAIVARMIADGSFRQPGVHPPETLGRQPALMARLLEELARRGVRVQGGPGFDGHGA